MTSSATSGPCSSGTIPHTSYNGWTATARGYIAAYNAAIATAKDKEEG